jgi:hypothetical protein
LSKNSFWFGHGYASILINEGDSFRTSRVAQMADSQLGAAAAGDLDGDSFTDLVIPRRETLEKKSKLYLIRFGE